MKILLISGSFFPVNSPRSHRTTELAKELAREGHHLKVIFPDNGYDYSEWEKRYPSLAICPTKRLKWKSIRLTAKKLKYWTQRIAKRLFLYLFEYPSIEWYFRMPAILKDEHDYDLLISIAVPHPIHWGVARCYKKGIRPAARWIADCGDPYMGSITDTFKHPSYFSFFEKAFCTSTSYITIPIEEAKTAYYSQFQDKIRVIPQGFNFEETTLSDYTPTEKIQFCYAGGFISHIRDPRPILDVLLTSDVDFIFYIFTNNAGLLADYRNQMNGKLVVEDYIPRLELIQFMSSMDFLVNIENGTTVQSPSKLIDYALTKRPILSLNSQQLNKSKLYDFLHRDYTQQLKVENIDKYNIKNVAQSFLSLSAK